MNSTSTENILATNTSTTAIDKSFERICYLYIGPVLCVFGVFGNILSLIVLTSGKLREAPYLYIRALAISDAGALLVSFPFMVFYGSTSYNVGWYTNYVFLPLVNSLTACSVWITVTMTIERFIVVKFPLWARSGCNRFGARVRIWAIVIAAFLTGIPRFFAYNIISADNVHYKLWPTDFRKSEIYYGLDVFCIISLHFLPLIILGIINTFLIHEVQNAKTIRMELNIRNNHESEFQRDQIRLTVTLISIVVLSLCFIAPATVSDILSYSSYHKTSDSGRRVSYIVRVLANVMLWCSLSLNFVLYCAFNKRFTVALKDIFHRGYSRVRNYPKTEIGRSFKTARSFRTSDITYV